MDRRRAPFRNRSLSVRSEVQAYRIRNWCHERGWEVTMAECAAALDLKLNTVRNVATMKGWVLRFRASSSAYRTSSVHVGFDGLDYLVPDHPSEVRL